MALGSSAWGCQYSARSGARTSASRSRAPAVARAIVHEEGDTPGDHETTFVAMTDASDPVPLLKKELTRAILDRMAGAPELLLARRLRVDQPRASNLRGGRLERFSLQQLVRFAARVDGEITISVVWTSDRLWTPRARVESRKLGS